MNEQNSTPSPASQLKRFALDMRARRMFPVTEGRWIRRADAEAALGELARELAASRDREKTLAWQIDKADGEASALEEQQSERCRQLAAALAELVACKDLKDEESRQRQRRDVAISRDREATARVDAMRDDYNRRKPLAWAAARAALNKEVQP